MITLATLPQATEQEVFDQVATHLLKQGKCSKKRIGNYTIPSCSYRGDNGLKCAAGILIADEEYTLNMDDHEQGTAWSDLVYRKQAPPEHKQLIEELQDIHDTIEPENWERFLMNLANDYGLQYNFPTHA